MWHGCSCNSARADAAAGLGDVDCGHVGETGEISMFPYLQHQCELSLYHNGIEAYMATNMFSLSS